MRLVIVGIGLSIIGRPGHHLLLAAGCFSFFFVLWGPFNRSKYYLLLTLLLAATTMYYSILTF